MSDLQDRAPEEGLSKSASFHAVDFN